MIFGDGGSINGFGTRGGRISMQQKAQEAMHQEAILTSIDGFSLEPLAEYLFPSGVSRWRFGGGLETDRTRILRTGGSNSQRTED